MKNLTTYCGDRGLHELTRAIVDRTLALLAEVAADEHKLDEDKLEEVGGAIRTMPQFVRLFRYLGRKGLAARLGFRPLSTEDPDLVGEELEKVSRLDILWTYYLRPFLADCLRDQRPRVITRFEELYGEFERSVYADGADWAALAPLSTFATDVHPVSLSNGVTIRRLTQKERRYFSSVVRDSLLKYLLGLEDTLLGAFTVVRARKGDCELSERSFRLSDVLTGLRIVRPGQVSMPCIVTWAQDPTYGVRRGKEFATELRPADPGPLRSDYTLSATDIELLDQLCQTLATLNNPALQLAVNRFNLAYERDTPEDRLIDCWVALEALLTKREERNIREKVALRAPGLLDEVDTRSAIGEDLRRSYKVRSAIVHGDRPKGDIYAMATRTEQILRQAIGRAILRPDSLRAALDLSS